MITGRMCLAVAGLMGFAAVGLGAYGAHGLDGSDAMLRQFDTANRYHMWHALALLGSGLLLVRLQDRGQPGRSMQVAAMAFVLGILLFSGTLYLSAALDFHDLAFLAPTGGLSFMVGWMLLVVSAARSV